MAYQVPDSKAAPRLYSRHQRYARPRRVRYSAQKVAFLSKYAASLAPSPVTVPSEYLLTGTEVAVFNYLYANTAEAIRKASSNAGLRADPYPLR